jgi:ANTAR domain
MNANGSARETDDDVVVRKAEHGWVVGGEEVSDLTSAMVLADLFAADHAAYEEGHSAGAAAEDSSGGGGGSDERRGDEGGDRPGPAAPPRQVRSPAATRPEPVISAEPRFVPKSEIEADEAARLAVTVTQLEHALASRVRVEQAIGVLAERHRVRPRQAFDLLRGAARSRGKRITDISEDVVASTANPLLRLPEELARQVQPKQRGRSLRRR